uniref:DM2 domain-containing protein n=1 Tax=Hyaloperonospora arabidopsidis (strain Emoy2) TaxID=559515 RepID=M4BNA1_HYAAE
MLTRSLTRAVDVQWTSFQKTSHDVDGLEVTRTGSTAHTVKIKLLPAHTLERFTISPVLKAVIGQYVSPAKAYTKQDIVLAMWQYIKLRNLIKEDDCRMVTCDDRLAQVLNCVSLPFTSIIVALKQHLAPVDAIDLEYTLNLSAACESELLEEQFFDVSVAATSELDRTRVRALKEYEDLQQDQNKELTLLKEQELDILERLQMYARKKEWMIQFAQDPCGFMADVEKSQLADEEILTAETQLDEFNIPHPQQFTQPWVRGVVGELLTTRSTN